MLKKGGLLDRLHSVVEWPPFFTAEPPDVPSEGYSAMGHLEATQTT